MNRVCVKLTDQDGRTRPGHPEETQWGPGVRHEVEGPRINESATPDTILYGKGIFVGLVSATMAHRDVPFADAIRWLKAMGIIRLAGDPNKVLARACVPECWHDEVFGK